MKNKQKLPSHFFLFMILFMSFLGHSQTVNVSGTLQKWHKISVSLTLPGNNLTEAEATFRNTRMDVIFTSPSGIDIRVPGYFAADGNAANTNANAGKVFRAFLRPNQTGNWGYRVLYYTGNNVAIANVNNLPSPVYNLTGSIDGITPSNKIAPDLRAKGRLAYKTTGTDSERRYLQFSETGEYYLKLGPDSPENFLNYNEFDADVPGNISSSFTPEHLFTPHAPNFNTGNPTWDGGKGRNIIGALNYLKDEKMNSVSMSLFGGDDKNVYPWTNPNAKFVYDVSKLEQWEIVLNHAEHNGLLLHLKLAENENWDALNSNEIKTYYREMIARFGHHLAVEWNFSEEYRGTPASAIERIDFMAANDPWQNHRVIHTYPDEHNKYATWLNLNAKLTGASIQSSSKINYASAYDGPDGILTWINNSKNAGIPWVVASDEQNPGGTGIFTSQDIAVSSVRTEARTRILWKTLIAGGPGVMWYGGGQGDFKTENFNRFNTLFNWSRYAIIDFFQNNNIEFWKTTNNDNLVSGNANCLAEAGRTYVIYLENGGSTNLNLNGQAGNFSVQWFNPRNGGTLLNGSVTQVNGGGNRNIGNPPNTTNADWVALVRQNGTDAVTGVSITQATVSVTQGQTSGLTASVAPATAANINVTWASSNPAIATVNASGVVTGVAEGNATITVTTVDGGFTDTSIVTVVGVSNAPCDYEEVNGLVVIEAENINITSTLWETKNIKTGFTGSGYLDWLGADSFGVPGNGTITTKIRINSPGKYKFEWRNTVGEGTNSTEANDSWLRFPDASDFYGEKPNGERTYPRGSGKTPNPEGAGADGWFKVYVNNLNWSWQTTTGDNADGRPIFVEFDTAGVYTMEISGRSRNHLIDRIVLSNSTALNPLALSNPETPCNGGNTVAVTGVSVSPGTVSINVGQTSGLTASITPSNATNSGITWSSNNNSVATVNASGVITAVTAGNAIITATTTDGGFTATTNVTVTGGSSCVDVNLNAVIDFPNRELTGFAPAYVDTVRNALAINASQFQNQFAAATTSFSGQAGNYDVVINTLTEIDGESTYRVFIDEVLIGTFQNPTTTVDYAPASQTFNSITVANEAVIRVEFNSNTNGNIPEGNGTAFSRGRWTSLEFICNDSTTTPVDCSDAPTGLAVSSVTNTSVTFSFDNATTDTRTFELRAFPQGGFTGNINTGGVGYAAAAAGSTTVTMPNLVAGTTYDFVFRALCPGQTPGVSPLAPTIPGTTSGGNTTIAVTGVSVTPTTATINIGQTSNLTATVAPANATDNNVTWSSSNTSIATVNTSGVVTAVSSGTATITVTSVDGGFTATTTITVNTTTPPTGDSITLGNVTNVGNTNDGWNSNLVINETDTYTNTTGASQQLQVDSFIFFARQQGDPVTPFIVKVNSDNNFTILAVGSTRTSAVYNVGENTLAFNTGTAKTITIANGETIATGFLDANANGSGGSIGSVIPFDTTAPADQIWYTGGPAFGNSGSVSEGDAPLAGLNTILTLNRNYHYKITLSPITNTADCSAAPTNLALANATNTSVTLSFDNTANDTRIFELRAFANGTFNGNINAPSLGFASASQGASTITMNNLVAGTTYDFVIRALCSGQTPGASPTAILSGSTTGGVVNTPQTATLSAIDDAYLQGSTRFDNMVLRTENGKRVSYLKFDVSAINGPITAATLKLTVSGDSGNGNIEVNLGNSNNWTETNLSTANAPTKGTLLGNLNKTYGLNQAQNFTLSNLTVNGNFLSLVVTQTNGNDVSFASDENTTGKPELTINYNGTANRGNLLDVKRSNNVNRIKAFPNPVHNRLNIDGLHGKSTINIMDFRGKIILKKIYTSQKVQLDVSRLLQGMYFIEIQNGIDKNYFKIIKN